jgi:alkane 1-monooxygenase
VRAASPATSDAVRKEPSGLRRRVGRTAPQGSTTTAAAAAKPLDALYGSSLTASDVAGEAALTWTCPGCSYTYDVVTGEEREGFAAGTGWAEIPDGWCCPDCGVRDKLDFVPVEPAIAP